MVISSILFWVLLIILISRISKSRKQKKVRQQHEEYLASIGKDESKNSTSETPGKPRKLNKFEKEQELERLIKDYGSAKLDLSYCIKYPSIKEEQAEESLEKMRSLNEKLRTYKEDYTKEIDQLEADWKSAKLTLDYEAAKRDLFYSIGHPATTEDEQVKGAIEKMRNLNEKLRTYQKDYTAEIDRMEKEWEEAIAAYKKKKADDARDSHLKRIEDGAARIGKEIKELETEQKKLLNMSLESLSSYPLDLLGHRMSSMTTEWEIMLESTKELAKLTPPIDCSDRLAAEAMVVLPVLVSDQLFNRGTGKVGYYPTVFMGKLRKGFADLASINPAYGDAARTGPYEQFWKRLTDFEAATTEAAHCGMMLPDAYGQINHEFLEAAQAMTRPEAEATIAGFEAARIESSLGAITALDPRKLLLALWFFAMEKPYQAKDLANAQHYCTWFFNQKCPDVKLAEWYAQRQLGGPDAITRIDNKEFENVTAPLAEQWASGLMWLQGYRQELDILQKMLESKLPMSPKVQERFHALKNGGENASATHQAVSNGDQLFFDVSALAWKDAEYNSLFENLAFQDKKLTYGLAVRDEDKDLMLPAGVSLPGKDALLAKFQSDFAEEYDDQASARGVEFVMLSGSGEEHMDGILAVSTECCQLGIAAHMARIGKKVNIKFYTLFLPEGLELAAQKQQVLSLCRKLNPTVNMWESGLKTSMLTAIQQLLNSSVQGGGQPGDPLPLSDTKAEEPVF